jgi:hypothetical protein
MSSDGNTTFWRIVLWFARLSAIAVLVPILQILVGEPGTGPANVREWIYLALFPIGFSTGYLIGWRWPITGGTISLACMVLSLVVIGRSFGPSAYLIWAVLCIPGALYVVAGYKLRAAVKARAT